MPRVTCPYMPAVCPQYARLEPAVKQNGLAFELTRASQGVRLVILGIRF